MNELANSIHLLFEPDSSPVVAVSGGMILFFNSAALTLFPTIEYGQRASSVLPSSFLDCDELAFVTTAQVNNVSVSANGVWYNGMLLLRMNCAVPKYIFSPEALAVAMRVELNAMRMALNELSKSSALESDPCAKPCLSVLYHSYHKLQRSCENLSLAELLAQRKVVFRPVSMDPAKWLKDMADLVTETAAVMGVSVKLSCPAYVPMISADPDLLESMLLNLLSNSLRHCKPGAGITLRIIKMGSRIQIAVDDSGAGFSNEMLGGLFQRHVDNTPGALERGDRMGLFIVWGIAEMHGGSVTVHNRKRGGASVRITLPVERKDTFKLHTPTNDYKAGLSAREKLLTALADALPDEMYQPKA